MAAIDWKELRRVFMLPAWTPTDCPNFLAYADKREYRKYALGIMPLLAAGGARVRWYGDRVETLRGDSPCETLMIVRYRSHRAMMAMILLPYYQYINKFRIRGTRTLQLSFTEPVAPAESLGREPFVLGVHADAAEPGVLLRRVQAAAEAHGLALSYASADRQGFTFIRRPRPNDPNPLQYPLTILLGAADEAKLRALAADPALTAALDAARSACVQLYRRASPRDILGAR